MKCKVEHCDRECMYQEQQVCQKHYFRMMRYGTYELTKTGKRKDRSRNAKGYQMLHLPNHPLAMANGAVYEHRKVIYDLLGECLPACQKCGRQVTWKTVHIDHIDEVVDNNAAENLRVLCRACNVMRSRVHIPQHSLKGRQSITWEGKTQTPTEWARDQRVKVSGSTIRRRIRDGCSVEQALFGKKITHQHTTAKSRQPEYGEYQGPKNIGEAA